MGLIPALVRLERLVTAIPRGVLYEHFDFVQEWLQSDERQRDGKTA
jgi:hypothetical protein